MAGSIPKRGTVAKPGFVSSARERCNYDRPILRLPVSVQHQWASLNMYNSPEGIHNGALCLTDVFVYQFHASGLLGSPTLPRTPDVMTARASQKADGGGDRVKLSVFQLSGNSGTSGVYGGGFKHRGSDSIGERAVHNISGYHLRIASD